MKKNYTEEELKAIHKHSFMNRNEVTDSKNCGCFYCGRIYPSSQLDPEEDYTDFGATALCPYCGIDSVIGDASKIHLTKELLNEMYKYFFT